MLEKILAIIVIAFFMGVGAALFGLALKYREKERVAEVQWRDAYYRYLRGRGVDIAEAYSASEAAIYDPDEDPRDAAAAEFEYMSQGE